ncbi:MAG: carboxypeptidase-like regulatory domain-containing protein [Muribaculaceae bacterium]|nr:carboxypeptidase-like regulatory domain-containing protein [Muribaculaceae bacterium]
MPKHFLFIWLYIFLLPLLVSAQEAEQLNFVVSGEVRDNSSGKKLENVNVTAPQRHLATVTNADGRFTLKTVTRPEYITFSHVGYRTQRVPLTDGTTHVKVRLIPVNIVLKDVEVTNQDPYALLAEAMARIPDNHGREAELMQCFYRETAKKRNKFISVSEAVIDLYKTSYEYGPGPDRVAIVKGRTLVSQKSGDTLGIKMQGGPTESVFLDVVKNRELILSPEELTHYELKMGDPVSIDDRLQLVVKANPNDDMLPYALYHATFYIDVETLAFTRAELSLDMSDSNKATRVMLVKKPRGVRFKPKELSLLVNYSYDGNQSHISYMRSTFRFNCDWKRRLFSTGFTAVNEMVVTDRQPCDKNPIDRKEAFKLRDSFSQMVSNFNDPDYWKDYNIIEPTESLDKAINKLKKSKNKR